jgi:hypothetical protein
MPYISDPNDFLFDDEVNEIEVQPRRRKQMKAKPNFQAIHRKAIDDAIARLKAVGCSFKIITPIDEEIFYDPDNKMGKPKKRTKRDEGSYSHGDLKKHYGPYLENVAIGQVVEVPYTDDLPYAPLQSSLSAYLSNAWGKGTYTTVTNKKTKMLEVLRLA